MEDKIVEAVREDLLRRSKRGIEKYGVTLDREDLTLLEWLQHTYEEVLDQANYLKKTITILQKENFSCLNPDMGCDELCDFCEEEEKNGTRTTDNGEGV